MVANIKSRATLDSAGFNSGLNSMEMRTSKFSKKMKSTGKAIQGLFAAAMFRQAVNGMRSYADEVIRLADVTGMSTDSIQRLMSVSVGAGIDQERLTKSFTALANAQGEARRGLKTYQRAFEELGISMQDVDRLNMEQLFIRVASGIAKSTDKTTALNTAGDIFGNRVGPKMIEVLNQVAKEGEFAGSSMANLVSEETLRYMDKFDSIMDQMVQSSKALVPRLIDNLFSPTSESEIFKKIRALFGDDSVIEAEAERIIKARANAEKDQIAKTLEMLKAEYEKLNGELEKATAPKLSTSDEITQSLDKIEELEQKVAGAAEETADKYRSQIELKKEQIRLAGLLDKEEQRLAKEIDKQEKKSVKDVKISSPIASDELAKVGGFVGGQTSARDRKSALLLAATKQIEKTNAEIARNTSSGREVFEV